MKKVLVIDDKKRNREAAIEQLAGLCDLTVVSTFQGGMNALRIQKFDLVLTDIMLPVGTDGSAANKLSPLDLNPSGLVLALYAAGNNIPVCMVTDLNHHHTEAISVAVADLELMIGSRIQCLRHENGKDWRAAYSLMGHCNEIPTSPKPLGGTVVVYGEMQEVSLGELDSVFSDAVKIALSEPGAFKRVFKAHARNLVIYSDLIIEDKIGALRDILSIVQPERQQVQLISMTTRGLDVDIFFREYDIEYQHHDVLELVQV